MITTKREYKYYLDQDRLASSINGKGFLYQIKEFLFPNYIWKFIRLMRKYEYLKNTNQGLFGKIQLIFVRIAYRRISLKLGFSIPVNVFGPGLSIPHYGTIVVNPAAKVGKNCRLHVGVNIGASAGSLKAPEIGDNVYIGPGVIMYGDITIVNNITIGANSTVNKSFTEEGVVIAGSPAKIVKTQFPVWWQNNRLSL
ncbi:serine acetyltransferase [Flavobacterium supellecticarium]|uniref:Serine acetyltransferase n=1 Tax=Flavobacterium supellecticarium TaxID=2565924 RepID=A0A4S3ZXE6_9FLAO|nr:serine acetyltransferase [Flavobacterium supellecticarium]THF50549.1 serine acetyltransferase [Flavobacterium supellecticarium]